jgi:hypothetical protein
MFTLCTPQSIMEVTKQRELRKPTLSGFRHSAYLPFISLSHSSLCVAGIGVPYISLKELRAELIPTTANKNDLLYSICCCFMTGQRASPLQKPNS